ncbi:unnamed protein product [Closterium sp. NIES-64]|nr:unnamed protein product [Closterium sp. NIES-64]
MCSPHVPFRPSPLSHSRRPHLWLPVVPPSPSRRPTFPFPSSHLPLPVVPPSPSRRTYFPLPIVHIFPFQSSPFSPSNRPYFPLPIVPIFPFPIVPIFHFQSSPFSPSNRPHFPLPIVPIFPFQSSPISPSSSPHVPFPSPPPSPSRHPTFPLPVVMNKLTFPPSTTYSQLTSMAPTPKPTSITTYSHLTSPTTILPFSDPHQLPPTHPHPSPPPPPNSPLPISSRPLDVISIRSPGVTPSNPKLVFPSASPRCPFRTLPSSPPLPHLNSPSASHHLPLCLPSILPLPPLILPFASTHPPLCLHSSSPLPPLICPFASDHLTLSISSNANRAWVNSADSAARNIGDNNVEGTPTTVVCKHSRPFWNSLVCCALPLSFPPPSTDHSNTNASWIVIECVPLSCPCSAHIPPFLSCLYTLLRLSASKRFHLPWTTPTCTKDVSRCLPSLLPSPQLPLCLPLSSPLSSSILTSASPHPPLCLSSSPLRHPSSVKRTWGDRDDSAAKNRGDIDAGDDGEVKPWRP